MVRLWSKNIFIQHQIIRVFYITLLDFVYEQIVDIFHD